MTTPDTHGSSERVSFQVQTRAELGPFRNYAGEGQSFAVCLDRADDCCRFSASTRILAFLNGGFYAIIWVDGIYQGATDLHYGPVADAILRPIHHTIRYARLSERALAPACRYVCEVCGEHLADIAKAAQHIRSTIEP